MCSPVAKQRSGSWCSAFGAGRWSGGALRGGIAVNQPNRPRSSFPRLAALFAAACALMLGAALAARAQRSAPALPSFINMSEGHVLGVGFDVRMVSNLENSVKFYKLMDFSEVPGVNPAWHVDKVFNQIYGIKGVESRMAKLQIDSNLGERKPFTLYLREFRGIPRRDAARGKPWYPAQTHIDLTVPDAEALWAKLKENNMLWSETWGGKLIAAPGATKGTIAYITDPDGMDVEIAEQSPEVPATGGRPARPDNLPGFNHIGLVIVNLDKAEGFYGALLGAQVPPTTNWMAGDFLDSAVGGHGNVMRIINTMFPLADDRDAHMRFELVQYENRGTVVKPYKITDSGVNCVGFEVSDIDAFVARLKGAGIQMLSDGIVKMSTGYRVVVFRGPDVGAFVEFYEPPPAA
jgi:catechol 2,3-dioxygenase-like lactoylglutathione lyase family enzyme